MRKPVSGRTIVRGDVSGPVSLLFCSHDDTEGRNPFFTMDYPSAADAELALMTALDAVRRVEKRINRAGGRSV